MINAGLDSGQATLAIATQIPDQVSEAESRWLHLQPQLHWCSSPSIVKVPRTLDLYNINSINTPLDANWPFRRFVARLRTGKGVSSPSTTRPISNYRRQQSMNSASILILQLWSYLAASSTTLFILLLHVLLRLAKSATAFNFLYSTCQALWKGSFSHSFLLTCFCHKAKVCAYDLGL
jgi:hypothetical protein